VPLFFPDILRAVASALRRFSVLIGVGLIAGLAGALYLPFLANPPVFDDLGFFSGRLFSYYATHPLGLELRVPPYFSLAIVQVIWGTMEAHRIVGLAFHVVCSLALYKLIFDLQQYATRRAGAPAVSGLQAHAPAFVAAAAFAVHPVAVYGAGYLIQRMSVFATLFSMVSILFYSRGLARRSHADALTAALAYSLAVLSRETAVMVPAAAVVAGIVVAAERRFALRHAALYLACCVPAAVLVTLLVKGKIGTPYEPDFAVVSAQIEQAGASTLLGSPWLESAVTQAGLYFRYLALWVYPDSAALSIDLRVDFAGAWPLAGSLVAVVGFVAYGVLGWWLMRGKGMARVAGFGLLYPWILFLPEFATIRFQEPFVLYRSYLWAPGLMMLLASGLARLPGRAVAAVALLVLPLLFYQAHDRLRVFSSSLALWEDAAAKLPRRAVPGGSRTLYNLGREYLYRDRAREAAEVAYYGAKVISAGGYYSVPRLVTDGAILIGESASLVDMARLKGIHLAIKSGMLAAEVLYRSLVANDFSARALEPKPDNIYLLVDGLPTMGEVVPTKSGVTGRERLDHFNRAVRNLPVGVPVNVILFAMEGDPQAAPAFWILALHTGGSMLAPAEDWP